MKCKDTLDQTQSFSRPWEEILKPTFNIPLNYLFLETYQAQAFPVASNLYLKARRRVSTQDMFVRNRQLFYKTLHIRLEEIFISAKAAAGGFTELKPGWFNAIDTFVDVTSDVISIAPFVGPLLSKLLKVSTDMLLKYLDKHHQERIVSRLSTYASLSELSELARSIAEQLTQYYAPQLRLIPITMINRNPKIGKSVQIMDRSPAQSLAEVMVLWILEGLETQTFKMGQTLSTQLVHIVTIQKPLQWNYRASTLPFHLIKRLFPHKKEALAFLNSLTVQGQDGKSLYLPYFVLKSGIQTNAGQRYTGPDMEPEHYGYCCGNIKIAKARHLRKARMNKPTARESTHRCFRSSPPAKKS